MNKKLLQLLALLLPLLAFAQPSNDECSGAILLTPGGTTDCVNSVSVSLLNATASGMPVNCDGVADDDVWYHFLATSNRHIITSSNFSGNTSALQYEIFDGSCSGLFMACGTLFDSNEIIDGLTPGTDYYIRIFTYIATPVPDTGSTFTLCLTTPPSAVTVSTTQYTVQQLVEDVIMPQTGFTISNITSYTGINSNPASENGIGYFTSNGSNFPLQNGLVLVSGNAQLAAGPNIYSSSSGINSWGGDEDLTALFTATNQNTNNVSKIEFDFVPDVTELSFNFVFASKEYGQFQCSYGDRIGIFVTDIATGVTTNLAVLPFTDTPISSSTVRNGAYSPAGMCGSANSMYFAAYYAPGSLTAPVNYNGYTVAFNTDVPDLQVGHNYHIKIAIADYADAAFDSALFIEAAVPEVTEQIVVFGPDEIYSCDDNNDGYAEFNLEVTTAQYLDGITPTGNYTVAYYETEADAIVEQNSLPLLYTNIINSGQTIYVRIESTDNTGLYSIEPLVLNAVPTPVVGATVLDTLYTCTNAVADITTNVNAIQGVGQFMVSYYPTQEDAQAGTSAIADPNATNLMGIASVWVRIQNSSYPVECFIVVEQPLAEWSQYVSIEINETDAQVVFEGDIDPGGYTYMLDDSMQSGPAFTSLEYGEHTVSITNNYCGTVVVINFIVVPPAPTGASQQTFTAGEALVNLEVEGENIQWYDAAAEGTLLSIETLLEDGETYYATQTINGTQSTQRLAVTANQAAGVNGQVGQTLRFYPNPVGEVLTVTNSTAINGATLYNALGQVVYSTIVLGRELSLDMRGFASGIYLLKVTAENGEALLKVFKE